MPKQLRKKREKNVQEQKSRTHLPGKIGAGVLFTLLGIIFALIMIMTAPQEDENAILTNQPLMTASPAVSISTESELETLLASFPVPVLCSLPGHDMTFIGGTTYDAAFENGVARIADMTYALPDGSEIVLTSIYPARASSLLKRDGYALIGTTELAGMEAVRMSREDSVRIHAQHSEAIYILTAPAMSFGELSGLAAGIQRVSMTK